MPKPLRSTLRRHSIKKKGTRTGLSKRGIVSRRQVGRTELSGKVKGYYGEVPRVKSSLSYGLGAYRASGGKTYKKNRERWELIGSPVYDRKKMQYYYFKYGVRDLGVLRRIRRLVAQKRFSEIEFVEKPEYEERHLRAWLDGEIPANVIDKPEVVADRIIGKRLGLGQRVAKIGGRGIMLENSSQSWWIEAVFERLTGVKYGSLKPGTMARYNEALEFTHYKNGKITLRYRGKSFDVTDKVNSLSK
jgi:hypothetical protein